ncbi:tripartite tricarboxylate transporter permease [Litorivicinus sp.]|nr:tripartite tricarboxylate transporter permease [Litorivicinus sp.]
MEVSLLDVAFSALGVLMDPERLFYLGFGTLIGLALGIMPGVGGVAGLALLLPFTFNLDAYSAFAFMLGLGAVTSTSDTIPAVLFGVPGTSASQATVLDGHSMAKNGEAGRALSAAYAASLIGGLWGAFLLGLTIPVLRPILMAINSPELLAFSIFGISMVSALSGSMPLRGLTMAGLGILLSMVGGDPTTGQDRWTLDTLYLLDDLPLLPVALGLFALPEICDVAARRTAISETSKHNLKDGMVAGLKDVLENWWLVAKCGSLGAMIGAIPGLGSAVVDWIAYGYAAKTCKGAEKTFGKGDVRGVIAPESANNAKEGGSLVPTIAFGVPGSASMALLLGGFMIHGLEPGKSMVTTNLEVTYAMVWSIALANILGAGLCFAFSGQFAKIATLRYTLVIPGVICIMMVGAYQASADWGDLATLLIFGSVGWVMKHLRWPRPPLILGFVLGGIIEDYMRISYQLYEWSWMLKPICFVMLSLAAISLFQPLFKKIFFKKDGAQLLKFSPAVFKNVDFFPIAVITLLLWTLWQTFSWDFESQGAPQVIVLVTLACVVTTFVLTIFNRPVNQTVNDEDGVLDLAVDLGKIGRAAYNIRVLEFFGWLVGFIAVWAFGGILLSAIAFVIGYMRFRGRESWKATLIYMMAITGLIYFVFDQGFHITWPVTVLGTYFPILHDVIPTM